MNNSFWVSSTPITNYPVLDSDIETDVCIIGAGITGAVTAYLLNKSGMQVTLLDSNNVCSGVSANTTAKLTSQHGLFYKYLADSLGNDFAKLYLQANQEAIALAKRIIDTEKFDCDFEVQDNFVYTTDKNNLENLKKEVNVLNSLDFPAEFVTKTDLPFEVEGAVKFPNQAQFHACKYVLSLINSFDKNGGRVYENSKVIDIKHSDNKYIVYTTDKTVTAKYVVLTTHYPIINFPGFHFIKMYQSKSYVLALDTHTDLFNGMYISDEEPTRSLKTVIYNGNRLLLVCGGDHKTGATDINLDDKYSELFDFAKQYYPNSEIKYQWTTEDCITLDKIPYIGQFSKIMPNLFVATGFNKWGMSSSHVAAKIIHDEILNIDNPYKNVFSATRLKPLKNYKEFGNMMKQSIYSLGINKFSNSDYNFSDLKNDSGGVVNYNGEKLGIYKDKNGKVFAVIPFCKHLGCELSWNNVDKTWDCPCHGSRYDYTGKLITEPSKYDLDIVKLY